MDRGVLTLDHGWYTWSGGVMPGQDGLHLAPLPCCFLGSQCVALDHEGVHLA